MVRLIRETMLKDSQQVHVAEVFLGGLLKPLSDIEVDTAPDYVQYGFIDGVRELLIDFVPSSYVLNVVEKVSEFVAKKVGLSLSEFAAVLRNPEEISESKLVEQIQPFAIVTAQILRRLGGEYVKIANELEYFKEYTESITKSPKNIAGHIEGIITQRQKQALHLDAVIEKWKNLKYYLRKLESKAQEYFNQSFDAKSNFAKRLRNIPLTNIIGEIRIKLLRIQSRNLITNSRIKSAKFTI